MASRSSKGSGPAALRGASKTRHRRRIRLVLWGFLLVYLVIAGRLFQLQVLPDAKYKHEDKKHIGTIEIQIPRGKILDRGGVVLATDKTVYSLWADPRAWVRPDREEEARQVAARLEEILGLESGTVYSRLTRRGAEGDALSFTWIKRWLAEEEVAHLKADEALTEHADRKVAAAVAKGEPAPADAKRRLKTGIAIRSEPLRFYPQGELAAQVIGFCTLDRHGGEGIESFCDNYLTPRPGRRTSRKDAQRRLLNSMTLEFREPEGGNDVYLTIDSAIQQTLEAELDKARESSKAPRAMGLIMDPRTGAILAMACRPAYNPNRFWDFQEQPELFKNRALVDAFEPGSSFKIVAAAAALEEKLITPETEFDCHNGSWNPYGHRISDYHPLGVEPFTVCFAESSNIAIIQVGAMLGPERLVNWIRRFGFGRKTSRDFPREGTGIVRNPGDRMWSGLSMGSLPMGQEIMVTVPQLARAFAVIANGGYLVEPYVVDRAVAPDGTETYNHVIQPPPRVLSPETAETMKQLCHLVTIEGTGDRARIEEYRVAGKTGTAQVAKPKIGYVPGLFTAIFAGFAPVDNPRVVAVILVEEPAIRLHFGGYICGPVFSAVVRNALVQMNVPPDMVPEEAAEAKTQPEETLEADPDTVLTELVWSGDEPSPDGLLTPLPDLELANANADSSVGPVLPDLRGLTKAEARARIAALGLPWNAQGAGWVVEQSPVPGTPLRDVAQCRLVFSDERNQGEMDGGNKGRSKKADAG